MERSVSFHGRANATYGARLLAAGALVAIGLVVGIERAGAQEATETTTPGPSTTATVEPSTTPTVEPSGTPTVEPSGTPTVEPSTTPTVEPSTTATPVPSATPTATPVDPRLQKVSADLDELETAIGDRLSDTTRESLADVRVQLTEFIAFADGITSGEVPTDSQTEAQLEEMAHDLRASLRGLKHQVQDDVHGLARGGGGHLVSGVRHDLNFVKHDVDDLVEEQRAALEAVLNGSTIPVEVVPVEVVPVELADAKTRGAIDETGKGKEKEKEHGGPANVPAPAPVFAAPVVPLPVAPAPKIEAPKVEAPKSETRKTEAPKAEPPKAAPQKPAEAPKPAEPPKSNSGGNGNGGGNGGGKGKN